MKPERKREMTSIWPRKRFESIREATRHKEASKAYETNAVRRPVQSPALPHSKTYGR
jgi:hypothetical protein